MRFHKNILTTFGACLLFTFSMAQPPKPPTVQERLTRLHEHMQLQVKPTPAQQTTIDQAFTSFFAGADKLRKDNPPPADNNARQAGPPAKVFAAMQQLEAARDEKIKKVLTAKQFEAYKTAAAALRPPRPGMQKRPPNS